MELDSSTLGLLLLLVLVPWNLFGVFLFRPIARRWGDSRPVRGFLAGTCALPLVTIAVGASLALHVKLRTGEWTYRSASPGVLDGELAYLPHPDAWALDPHRYALVLLFGLTVLAGLLGFPLFLGFRMERQVSLRLTAVFWASLLIAVALFSTDAGGVRTVLMD